MVEKLFSCGQKTKSCRPGLCCGGSKNDPGSLGKKSAFTLIELLVVIVIIRILATVSVAQFNTYQEKARRAKALTHYGQVVRSMSAIPEAAWAYWPVNDTDIPAEDISGNGLTFITLHQSTPNSEGFSDKSNGSLLLTENGPNDNPFDSTRCFDNTFTLSQWVKVTKTSTSSNAIKLLANGCGVHTGFSSNGRKPYIQLFANNTNYSYTASSAALFLEEWNYMVTSFDGITAKIYLNGNLVLDRTVDVALQNQSLDPGSSFKLGWVYSDPTDEMLIDEIHIWDEPLNF